MNSPSRAQKCGGHTRGPAATGTLLAGQDDTAERLTELATDIERITPSVIWFCSPFLRAP